MAIEALAHNNASDNSINLSVQNKQMHRSYCHTFFTLFLSLFLVADVPAQCIHVDSVTPYIQDFEASNGNWAIGGSSSDWVWGHPNKTIITGAANGQNCWITGGLTGSAYNAGQRSYLISPCFDFSTLSYPYIEFKTFWETENKYGWKTFIPKFEYTTDNAAMIGIVGYQKFLHNKFTDAAVVSKARIEF